MINFVVDDSEITSLTDHWLEGLENLPMEQIGEMLVDSVHRNFDEEGRPTSWEPRQDDNPWPILNKTGHLYNSIHVTEVGTDFVNVDSDAFYGDWQDQGTSRIPARPFLVIQSEDEEAAQEIIWHHLGL